jgi:hypothetical protein
LDVGGGSIGAGVKLSNPGLFGGPDDKFVVASTNSIAVVTSSGKFWPRVVDANSIGFGTHFTGYSLFVLPTLNMSWILGAAETFMSSTTKDKFGRMR